MAPRTRPQYRQPPGVMGRPMKLTGRMTIATDDGDLRTLTVAEAIWEEVERTGHRPTLAAEVVGVTRESISKWWHEGLRLIDKAERGLTLNHRERVLVDFVHGCQRAKARWVTELEDLHRSIVDGDLVIGEITEKIDPTQQDRDGAPLVIERTVRRKRTIPDAAAIRWELSQKAGDEGYAARLEVTGADGAPLVPDDTEERARALLAEIEAYEQGVVDGRARVSESTPEAG